MAAMRVVRHFLFLKKLFSTAASTQHTVTAGTIATIVLRTFCSTRYTYIPFNVIIVEEAT